MNKLFTKIVGACLGLTMAVGVGVAVSSSGKAAEPVAAAGGTFTKITSISDLTSGKKFLIVSDDDKLAFNGSLGTIDAISNTQSVTISSNSITTTSDFYFTITSKSGGYSIKGSGGKYIGSTAANSNELKSSSTDDYTNTIEWNSTNSCFVIRGTNSYLIYNGTSGQTRYRYYKPATCNNGLGAGSYHKLSLYKEASSDVTVTFNANGHGTAPSSQTITSGGKVTQPTAPTATGWTFGGWYKEQACTNAWNFSTDTVSKNTTLWAKWTAKTYSISYALNGGTHGSTHPTSGTYDTAFSVSAPTKTGYTFTGWTVTSGLNTSTAKWGTTSSPSTAISSSSTLCVNGTNAVYFKNINAASTAVTLTANWSINSYTIGGTISDGHLSSTANVDYNDSLSITIVPDQDFIYPSSIDSVTMGGAAYAGYTYDSTDGSFSIEHVTGNVVINAACVSTSATERFFDYHLTNCSIENAPESMYDTEMKVLQIVADDHYKFPSSITVTGISDENWEYDADEGTILINEPDGDIDITVTCVAKAQNIITIGTLTGVTQKSGDPTTVEEGDVVTLTFIVSSGYGLPTSSGVTVTGVDSQSWSWNQNSGELEILGGTSNITVSVVATLRDLINGSLTLGTKKTSYTTGDDFELPSSVTANFNIAPLTVDVKNDVEISGPYENGVVTGSGTITLTYTYEPTGSTQSASYAITATPITPVTGGYTQVTSSKADWSGTYVIASDDYLLGNTVSSGRIANGGDAPTVVDGKITSTVTDAMRWTIASTTGGYTFKNLGNNKYLSSTGGKNAGTMVDSLDSDGKTTWTISFSSDTFTIVNKYNSEHSVNATLVNNSTYGWATYASNSSGKTAHLYEYTAPVVAEIKWITAEVKAGTYYQGNSVTASDFTVTAHYNDGNTSTLSTGVTVTNGYLANIGNNEVTLTYSGKSCIVNVTAVEQTAEYTGLSWAQGEYTIIDGQNIDFSKFGTVTAEYDDGEAYATKAISSCTIATYTKSGDVYTKVADLSDGAKITSSSHGKYLGVTYTETNTYTAYSSDPIYVVESINTVQSKVKTWTFTDKATSIKVGDEVVIGAYYTSGTTNYELAVENTDKDVFDGASYATNPAGTIHFEVVAGSSSGTFAFKNGSNYLACSTVKSLTYSTDLDEYSSWNVTFNGTEATISNAHDSTWILQFNYNQGNTRFAAYASEQVKPFLVLGSEGYTPVGEDIANTNAAVQKAVLQFAEHFNDTMDCVNSGATTNVAGKWSTLSSDFETAMSAFTGDDLAHFKALFANADSVDGGDTLQDMLARYDYIVAKYKLSDDFLHDDAGRGAVQYANVVPHIAFVNDSNTVAIITVISMISVTAVGGYFLLRRRKEVK